MTRTRRTRVLAAAASLAMLAGVGAFAAPSGAATRAPRASAHETGVTGGNVLIGATAPLTGPVAPGYDEISPATNAVFEWFNHHGKVNGRTITYKVLDDGYDTEIPTVPSTVQQTNKLISDGMFADVGSLGTAPQLSVQGLLNRDKIPQMFVESGCACWSAKAYPWTSGWQPNYIVEGKLLGHYVVTHYKTQKVGYLYQNDEFGQDGVKGLNEQIPRGRVVAQPNYIAGPSLSTDVQNGIAKLAASHAKIVVLYTLPIAAAVALATAAHIGYHPLWVSSSVAADGANLYSLLLSIGVPKSAAPLLMNGIIANAYLPPATASNAWSTDFKKCLAAYDPKYTPGNGPNGWNGNSQYGAALGYAFVQVLQKAGRNLTRQGLINALAAHGRHLQTPGLTPLQYTASDHYGYSGSEIVELANANASGATAVVKSPRWVTTNSPSSRIVGATQNASAPPAGLCS
jgi:ABC-type branched-subunit amino acid transport system substrate-binding protein